MFKNFCPEVETQRVAQHLVLLPPAWTVLDAVVVVEEVGVEPYVHKVERTKGCVEAYAALPCGADVGRLAEGDYTTEAVAVGHIGEGACKRLFFSGGAISLWTAVFA